MEKTAIQEAIKQIVESWSSPGDRPNYTQILNILESKLEMEKQNIENAWTRGNRNTDVNGNPSKHYAISSEQYYQKTFNKE